MKYRTGINTPGLILLLLVCVLSFSACGASGQEVYEMGRKQMSVGNYNGAERAFSIALKAQPDDSAARAARAGAYTAIARASYEAGDLVDAGRKLELAAADYEAAGGSGDDSSIRRDLEGVRSDQDRLSEYKEHEEEYSEMMSELCEIFSLGDREALSAALRQEKYRRLTGAVSFDHMIFEGQGLEKLGINSNGSFYFGPYDRGRRNGHGIWMSVRDYGIQYYDGEWSDDLPEGDGIWTLEYAGDGKLESLKGRLSGGCFDGDIEYYMKSPDQWRRDLCRIHKGRLISWTQVENSAGFIYSERFRADDREAVWYVGGLPISV